MSLWQFGPYTVCNSHIGSVSPRAIRYTQLIYPLPWNEKSRIWQSLGYPRSHNQGRPCGRLWFHGSLDLKLYVPAILSPWVQGYFVHIALIPALLWNQNRIYGLVWDAVVPKGCLVHIAPISKFFQIKNTNVAKFGWPYFHKLALLKADGQSLCITKMFSCL